MVEHTVSKNAITAEGECFPVFTGEYGRELLPALERFMAKAKRIDIMVAYVRESGVRLLLPALMAAVRRGAVITLLTGRNFNLTEPQALYLFRYYLGDAGIMKFYQDTGRSFHPKAYFVHFDTYSYLFVGSSNLSASALGGAVEWNYCLDSRENEREYMAFYQTFQDICQNHSLLADDEVLQQYARNWRKPGNISFDDWLKERQDTFRPRGAQIEALYYLSQTRAEGAEKALVHAATGIGKTYLAAFDSQSFATVLFIAHQEEILRQAAEAFRNVRNLEDYGFFTGKQKQTGKAVIFASVETLGQVKYLNDDYFAMDQFDYIVVDEFHHAVSNKYRNILAYFRPRFLLGLTATTERLDGRNIYALCDYNVAYELPLFTAINRGMLVPFRYYGIYDDTDYRPYRPVAGTYAAHDLNCLYLDNIRRMKQIVSHYRKYKSQRALGFCATREHAEAMAEFFIKQGIQAVAVYSNAQGAFTDDRKSAVEQLIRGDLKVIFAVDMFNEGIDIPALDMVMFLRPTESPIVFMQQLGRGLRLYPGKSHLTVLDFIGNYRNAGMVKGLLSREGQAVYGEGEPAENEYPDNCWVDFDLQLIDLFREADKNRQSLREVIKDEFYRIKSLLGKRPSRMELFENMTASVYELCLKHAKENPFKHYLAYLVELGEATPTEQELVGTIAEDFLQEIAATQMTKVYKMPVLLAMQEKNSLKAELTYEDVLAAWKKFFIKDRNWQDLPHVHSKQEFQELTDKWHLDKIRKMPLRFLQSDFIQTGGIMAIHVCENLKPYLRNEAVAAHFRDIVNYRAMDYYRRRYMGKIK
ncbi:DEAD/DEAH box helicase family protein [Selenomonas ruminantium]|nr:DEAD/DEAH box helicase family protein [Selenomonas ruminantium]